MRRFISQAWLSFKGQNAGFNFEHFILLDTFYPLITLIFYCVLAGYSFNTQSLTTWVVGNSFLLCINTCIFALGAALRSERYFGRLRFIIASPHSKLLTILEKGLFPIFISTLTVLIGFVIGSLIFGVNFTNINFGLFFLTIMVAMFSATALGLLLATIGMISDQMHLILNLSSYILIIFCGANFPISQFPKFIQYFSRIVPLTNSISAANMLFDQFNSGTFALLLLSEFLIGTLLYLLSFFLIKHVERKAIKNASYDVF